MHVKGNWRSVRRRIMLAVGTFVFMSGLHLSSASSDDIEWIREFQSTAPDGGDDIAGDGGSVYAVGFAGRLSPDEVGTESVDAYIRSYSVSGDLLWIRRFGHSLFDFATSVAVDGDAVYAAGVTGDHDNRAELKAFLIKYDTSGDLLWLREFGPVYTTISSLAVDGLGGIYVVGHTSATLPGQMEVGGNSDAFIRKYDGEGEILWTRQFGSSTFDLGSGVAIDDTGVYVVGKTGGNLSGDGLAEGGADVFIRKYRFSGEYLWTRQFGSSGGESAWGIAAGGGVTIVGQTSGVISGDTNYGRLDIFVAKFRTDGET